MQEQDSAAAAAAAAAAAHLAVACCDRNPHIIFALQLTQEVSGAGAAVDCNKSCQMMAARIGDCGYFLRAHELMIKHPRDGRLLVFKAPPCHPFDGVG